MRTSGRTSIVHLLSERAAAGPRARAFTFLEGGETEGDSLSWSALDERTRAIGAAVASRVPAGARVLLLFPPGLDIIPAFFGALAAGTIAIPVYPPAGARMDRTVVRLRGMIADAGVTLVVSTNAVRVKAEMFNAVIPELSKVSWLTVDDLEIDPAWGAVRTERQSIAFLQYTSGSTASPRGVMVTHDNLLHNLRVSEQLGRFDATSIGVSWLPVNHDMGLIQGVLQPIFSGFPCWLMSPASFLQRPSRWLTAISRYRATHSGGPNFAYDLCSRRLIDEKTLDLTSWRVAFNGSEPIRQDTLETFARVFAPCGFHPSAFRPAYGLAEATLLVSSTEERDLLGPLRVRRDALREGRAAIASGDDGEPSGRAALVSCGKPGAGMEIEIVDPVRRVRCPSGTVGEIWVRGGSVTAGYWRRPADTSATFAATLADTDEGPFLRTGDLGFLSDGRLYVTGRIKDVLIVRGVKHYPQDIERSIDESHPVIRPGCCAVFAMSSEHEEDQIGAAVEVDLRASAEPGAELARVIDRIRSIVVQQHGVQLNTVALIPAGTLPKTTSGKLQRFACRDGLSSGTLQTLAVWTDGRVFFGTPLERTA